MRYQIRRDRNLTYDQQMQARKMDAERSRQHPNSIFNDSVQRAHSRKMREMADLDRQQAREARRARRAAYKSGQLEHKFAQASGR